MIKVTINKKNYELDIDPETPLLWVLRDAIGLVGTKYGCGVAQCGACVVHLNGEAVRSCVTKISRAAGQNVVTIEGLSEKNDHPLQKAWMDVDVVQCGYCQAGQIMAAAVLLRENNNPTDDDIDKALEGNICRCGTYLRIKKAIHLAAAIQRKTTVK
jgi:isoquinoline 1-oxidoreductase alpha subunit